jgi:hypothetical protein
MNDTCHAAPMHLPAEDCSYNPPCQKKICSEKAPVVKTRDVYVGGGDILAQSPRVLPGLIFTGMVFVTYVLSLKKETGKNL